MPPTRPLRKIARLIRADDTGIVPREHRASRGAIGTHLLADFWECSYEESGAYLLPLTVAAAREANADVLGSEVHEFAADGGGTTVLLLLAESHLSLHTWPEHRFIAVDLFTCGPDMRPHDAVAYLERQLSPSRTRIDVIDRGRDEG